MSVSNDNMKNPKEKAMLIIHNVQSVNDILNDPDWLSMTTTLGMYRNDPNFHEILRSFWTTICVSNGIMLGSTVYECLFDKLCEIYKSIGISIDKKFMEAFLDLEADDPDDL